MSYAAVPVKVFTVKQNNVATSYETTAKIYSQFEVHLSNEIEGQLKWIAEPGQWYEKNQIVAKIDTFRLENRLATLKNELEHSAIEIIFYEKELKRLAQLLTTQLAAEREYDRTELNLALAKNQQQHKKIQIELINDDIQRGSIKAPFSGIIAERLHQAGENIAEETALLHLIDPFSLEARIELPIKYQNKVKPEHLATIYSQQQAIDVAVHALIPATDFKSQSAELRAKIPPQNQLFFPGQIVSAQIQFQRQAVDTLVHRDAILVRQDGLYLARVTNNIIDFITIETAQGDGELVSVKGDLRAGDQVVIRGGEQLEVEDSVLILE